MSTKQHAERLARALESTDLAQAVKLTHADARVNILCRVKEGNEKQWVQLVHNMLMAADVAAGEVHAFQAHICRNYFLKEENKENKLVWGWNVSIQSQHMSDSLDALIAVIKGKPVKGKVSTDSDEFYVRRPASANLPDASGKGVHLIGEKDFHPARKR